jgi:hypothetical protein
MCHHVCKQKEGEKQDSMERERERERDFIKKTEEQFEQYE